MDELVTTLLDVLGLLLIAGGACALAFPYLGWGGLTVSGVAVLAGSWWATRQPRSARGAKAGEG